MMQVLAVVVLKTQMKSWVPLVAVSCSAISAKVLVPLQGQPAGPGDGQIQFWAFWSQLASF